MNAPYREPIIINQSLEEIYYKLKIREELFKFMDDMKRCENEYPLKTYSQWFNEFEVKIFETMKAANTLFDGFYNCYEHWKDWVTNSLGLQDKLLKQLSNHDFVHVSFCKNCHGFKCHAYNLDCRKEFCEHNLINRYVCSNCFSAPDVDKPECKKVSASPSDEFRMIYNAVCEEPDLKEGMIFW